MHWLKANFYLIAWLALPVVFAVGVYRLLSQTIIVKGDITRLMLYLVAIAAFAAVLTPQLDDAGKYCAKIIFVPAVLAILYYRKHR